MVEYKTTIDEFHNKHYQKSIYKLAHHLPHVKILGTNETGKTRKEAFHSRGGKGDMQSKRDYAERLTEDTGVQIQSQHWGANCSLSMEGQAIEYWKRAAR